MIKPVLIFLCVVLLGNLFGQGNLVPNWSFEEYTECPSAPGSVGDDQLERCKSWYKPNGATTDYYNSCQKDESTGSSVPNNWYGFQNPKSGNAYVGVIIYEQEFKQASEYIQCRLISPLKSCHTYRVSFYASLADYSSRATSVLGLRLDQMPLINVSVQPALGFELPPHITTFPTTISDTSNWQKIEGYYVANGGEEFLTLGRFFDTSIYSNENVPWSYNDCETCQGFGNGAQYYIDDISVTDTEETVENILPNVITVDENGVNDIWYPNGICFNDWRCSIINRWGEEVFSFGDLDIGWNGRDSQNRMVLEGVYYYIIIGLNQAKTGFIQLVR